MQIGVIGAGAWGTAFSIHLARKGFDTLLWVYESDLLAQLSEDHVNSYYLPDFRLPENIRFTGDIKEIAGNCIDIIIATPSFAFRKTLESISGLVRGKHILSLTKGIEDNTFFCMSEIAEEVLVAHNMVIASLSGPSFAREVAQGTFTSVVIASKNKGLASHFQTITHNDQLRVYTSNDIKGVELGGAMKNVMAIGAGIIEGLNLGTNTQAAFTTRALAEIKRLGKALGAKETTFMGLSGIGDLILTSYGRLSRNRSFGAELAKGKKPEDVINQQKSVVEGYYTVKAAYKLSKACNVEMPITEELYKILYEEKDLMSSLNDITTRAFKEEEH